MWGAHGTRAILSMVCPCPAALAWSKARRKGAVRAHMAHAAMRASGQAMSVAVRRCSGIVSTPLCPKCKRASAARGVRPLGATRDLEPLRSA